MSEENVESMRRTLDAFDRGDKAAWLAEHDPDVVMIPARQWPENAPIRGADAVWDFYLASTGTWDNSTTQIGEVIGSGDTLVINNRREARGRTSGATVEFSYWIVVTFRSRKMIRQEWFAARAEALVAAGLSE